MASYFSSDYWRALYFGAWPGSVAASDPNALSGSFAGTSTATGTLANGASFEEDGHSNGGRASKEVQRRLREIAERRRLAAERDRREHIERLAGKRIEDPATQVSPVVAPPPGTLSPANITAASNGLSEVSPLSLPAGRLIDWAEIISWAKAREAREDRREAERVAQELRRIAEIEHAAQVERERIASLARIAAEAARVEDEEIMLLLLAA